MLDREEKWDKLLRIKTLGRDDSNATVYYYPYEPTPYCVLERLANSGYIGKRNVIVDYGAGKGRVDFFLAYQTKCRAIGIEYDERIWSKAEENKISAVSGTKVSFIHTCAETYPVPSDADRFYFFNPFSLEILQKTMNQILASYYENMREILLFFYYPSAEYISWLMTSEHVMFCDEISCSDLFEGSNERECIMIFEVV